MRNFVPHNVAVRIKKAVEFTVKLDGRCPELRIQDDKQTLDVLTKFDEMCKSNKQIITFDDANIDYESVPVLRDHKIKSLRHILQEAVDRKYKISFHKGVQIVIEQLILLILMINMILKANIFSIFYLLFVFRYL